MEKNLNYWDIISQLSLKEAYQKPKGISFLEEEEYRNYWALREAARLSALAYLGLAEPLSIDYKVLAKAVLPYLNGKMRGRKTCEEFVQDIVPEALFSLTDKGKPSVLAVCALGLLRTLFPQDIKDAIIWQGVLQVVIRDSAAYDILQRHTTSFDGALALSGIDNGFNGDCWRALLRGKHK